MEEKPDGSTVLEEAHVDVELFGHPVAPSRYLDGTIRHPAGVSMVGQCSRMVGFAASEGEKAKWKRYSSSNGKEIIPCSMETWGSIGNSLEALLRELSVLASQRQRERGILPTKWFDKWSLQVSMNCARHIGKALLASVSVDEKYSHTLIGRSTAFHDVDVDESSPVERDTG